MFILRFYCTSLSYCDSPHNEQTKRCLIALYFPSIFSDCSGKALWVHWPPAPPSNKCPFLVPPSNDASPPTSTRTGNRENYLQPPVPTVTFLPYTRSKKSSGKSTIQQRTARGRHWAFYECPFLGARVVELHVRVYWERVDCKGPYPSSWKGVRQGLVSSMGRQVRFDTKIRRKGHVGCGLGSLNVVLASTWSPLKFLLS